MKSEPTNAVCRSQSRLLILTALMSAFHPIADIQAHLAFH